MSIDNESLIPQRGDDDEDDDILTGCGATLPCDPRRRLYRYLMLFFICFLSFGSYFCFDNPAALQDAMIRSLSISETQFMNLYAFYSWPNIVLSFAGGFLIDRVFGVALGAVIFAFIVLGGQLILGVGAYVNSLYVMYFARFLFGIGGESLCVAANTYTTTWFSTSELNFVFGLQLSMSRVGSTVNMLVMQPLLDAVGRRFGLSAYRQLGVTLLIASITCLFSVTCAIILAYFYRRSNRILKAWNARLAATANGGNQDTASGEDGAPHRGCPSVSTKTNDESSSKIAFKDILHFPGAIWLICLVCVAYYVAVFPFIGLGIVFFERKYQMDAVSAAAVNSLVFIVSAVASPFFGAAIDFTGRNLVWLVAGVVITSFCHIFFAFSTWAVLPPIVVMIVFGLAYSILASSLWPMVAFLLPVHQRGTAYGLIQSVQNLGLGVVSIFTGFLVDSKGYLFLELFFILCLAIALTGVFGLYAWDQANQGILNCSGKARKLRLAQPGRRVDPPPSSPSTVS